ncbi:amino acid adenylation domain-containing protein [Vibrio sp. M250220]|uniref:non-ribosomal peptide synthetase n=1 Tax=Vibrio sp. M250220 TaxID=3020894 RepID=UPI002F400A3C
MTYPLSHAQNRCWIAQELLPNTAVSTIGGIVRIHGEVDIARLEQAIQAARNEFLPFHLYLCSVDGNPVQRVSENPTGIVEKVHLPQMNLQNCSVFESWADEIFRSPLSQQEFHYFTLFQTHDGGGYIIRMHHAFADGWAMSLLTSFIERAYKTDEPINYRESSPSFLESLNKRQAYFSSSNFERDRQFWSERLTTFNAALPTLTPSTVGGQGYRTVFTLSKHQSKELKDCAKILDLSVNQLWLLLYAVYIGHRDGTQEGVIGCPLMDRHSRVDRQVFGMMTTHAPFIWKLDPDESFMELAKRVKQDFANLIRHSKCPLEHMQDEIPESQRHHGPLFDGCINYYAFDHSEQFAEFPQTVEDFYTGYQTYRFQIVIREWQNNGVIQLIYDDAPAEDTRLEIKSMHDGMLCLMVQVNAQPEMSLRYASVLPDEYRQARMKLLTGPVQDTDPLADVITALHHFSTTTPNAPVLHTSSSVISYQDLFQDVQAIAQTLQDHDVGLNASVGILVRRSPQTIASILAVLWVGASFVPLNHDFPIDRLSYMIEKAEVSVILHDRDGSKVAKSLVNQPIDVTKICTFHSTGPAVTRGDRAYVLFTSGSTGQPKGVEVSRANLENYLHYSARTYYTATDCSAFYTPITFDLTLTSILSPIVAGASIRIYQEGIQVEQMLTNMIEDAEVTILKITPSHLKILQQIEHGISAIRSFIVGGENLQRSLAEHINTQFPDSVIYNEYGPTEATVGCLVAKFDSSNKSMSVPIGLPIDNMSVRVLSAWGSDVPIGATGELVVAGASVAQGYIKEPSLTMDKFSTDPNDSQKRIYQTGDVVAFFDENTLVYLGRRDRQVKILGNRIELDEVENIATNCPEVTQAVAVVLHDQQGEPSALGLIYSPEALDSHQVHAFLTKALPRHMMPNMVIGRDVLPLSANGKVDTEKLVECLTRQTPSEVKQQTSAIELSVSNIIQQVLEKAEIGMNDNLFLLGLDSIKSLRIAAKLDDFSITSSEVIQLASIGAIADLCECRAASVQSKTTEFETLSASLTLATQWFLDWYAPKPDYYAQYVTLTLQGDVQIESIKTALRIIIARHSGLRKKIESQTGHFESLDAESVSLPIVILEKDVPSQVAAKKVTQCLQLDTGQLMAVGVFTATPQKLLLAVHHAAIDAYSWFALLQEFDALLKNGPCALKRSPLPTVSNRGAYLAFMAQSLSDVELEQWQSFTRAKGPQFQLTEVMEQQSAFIEYKSQIALDGEWLENQARDIYGLTGEMLVLAIVLHAIAPWSDASTCQIELERTGRTVIPGMPPNLNEIGWFSAIFPVAPPSQALSWDQRFKDVKAHIMQLPPYPEVFAALRLQQPERFAYQPSLRLNPLGSSAQMALDIIDVDMAHSGLCNETGSHSQCGLELDIAWNADEILLTLRRNSIQMSNMGQLHLTQIIESSFKEAYEFLSAQDQRVITATDFDEVDLSEDELSQILVAIEGDGNKRL